MLNKILSIQNVGRFENYKAKGDVELSGLTLVFAENSRGKTTLCDILRSLQTGDGSYIEGRRRLDTKGEPGVELRIDAVVTRFKSGVWSTVCPDVAIFDSAFIHRNVFAGDSIEHDHKRNLYRVIVGEQGVKLAKAVDDLDAQIREHGKDHTAKKHMVEMHAPRGMQLAEFMGLEAVPNVDVLIAAKNTELVAAAKSASATNDIKSRGLLKAISLPEAPKDLAAIVGKSLETLSKDAEARLRAHLSGHTNGADEMWVGRGLSSMKDGECPFCGQGTKDLALVEAYRAYFDKAYIAFKGELTSYEAQVRTRLAASALTAVQRDVGTNGTLGAFWSQFGGVVLPSFDLEALDTGYSAAAEAIEALLRRKALAPLDAMSIPAELAATLVTYEGYRTAAVEYNEAIAKCNKRIQEIKAAAAVVDVEKVKKELASLETAKKRHTKDVVDAVGEYVQTEAKRKKLDGDKGTSKAALDKYCETVMKGAEKRLNEFLEMFCAGFRIANPRRSFVGGKTSSTYQIVINGVPIELGDASTPLQTASFRNTLSAGDKSTLALAFFLIQMEQDPEISKKTVVFDDPFTSQDRSRRVCTQQQVLALSAKAQQVIVMSHDPNFLRGIWDDATASVKTLQLCRMGSETSTILSEWDIEEATKGDYAALHKTLWAYVHQGVGTPRTVAQNIRLVLEQYLRLKLPHTFDDKEWLGDFINKIRNAEPDSPVAEAKGILTELEAINGYSKRYHHNQNTNAATEPIDDGELMTYSKKTLKLVGGF